MSTTSYTVISDIEAGLATNFNVKQDSIRNPCHNRLEISYDYKDYDITVTKLCPNCGEEMDFGSAIRCMQKGLKVARKGWNGKNMWLCIPLVDGPKEIPATGIWGKPNAEYAEENGGTVKVMPYITMKTADGSIVMGWLASQTDMLSEDWVVVS